MSCFIHIYVYYHKNELIVVKLGGTYLFGVVLVYFIQNVKVSTNIIFKNVGNSTFLILNRELLYVNMNC